MNHAARWSRILVIAGLVAMLLGALDPLEGSVVIVAGLAASALGAWIGGSRHRSFLAASFGLAAIGVAALFGMSAMGGVGGTSGRSIWWLLLALPYPIGWVMGLVGTIRRLREPPADPARAS